MYTVYRDREVVVMGIDPSFVAAGFGVMRVKGNQTILLDHGMLKMSSKESLSERVGKFHAFFDAKIREYSVTIVALETPFLGKNTQSFLKLGYLRGIVYLLQHVHQIELREFAPMEVKRGVTGFGAADKEQVARVVMRLFPAIVAPKSYDVTDAVAVTLCGAWQR